MTVMTAPPKIDLITGEDLLAMGDVGPCELIEGRIVTRTPTGDEHGTIEFNLGSGVRAFVRRGNLGRVTGGEVGIYIRRKPDTVRAADIVVVSSERRAKPTKGYLEVAPELVVEIMSPTDRWHEVRGKLDDYFSIGVERVWIVEPERRTVLVYRSTTDFSELSEDDLLKGEGILHGFELSVAELFADL